MNELALELAEIKGLLAGIRATVDQNTHRLDGHLGGDELWQAGMDEWKDGLTRTVTELRVDFERLKTRYDTDQSGWARYFGRDDAHPGRTPKAELNGTVKQLSAVAVVVTGIFWFLLEIVRFLFEIAKSNWSWLRKLGE